MNHNGRDAEVDGQRASLQLTSDQFDELEAFKKLDLDNSGFIEEDEMIEAFNVVGLKIAPYEVRKLIAENDINIQDGKLDFAEFLSLCARLKRERDYGRQFKKMIKTRTDVQTLGGMAEERSTEGTTHSIAQDEMVSFSDWINKSLNGDPICGKFLPIDIQSGDLYQKLNDGILLCGLINYSVPNTIDPRAINSKNLNLYRKGENLTLAINSAESVGCSTTNIHVEDISRGKPHICLALIWQIVRIGLLNRVNLHDVPGLLTLKREDETLEHFMHLPPEEILYRWVNYHLKNAGTDLRINNFSSDIKDSLVYTYLLHQIGPKDKGVTLNGLRENDENGRAKIVLGEADKLDARRFVTNAHDITSGNPRLNLAFVANLFNNYPALETPEGELGDGDLEQFEESREEKTYRNWMNSLGVNPYVYHLYTDLTSGLIIFQIYDIIKPGLVNWTKVHYTFHKMKIRFEMLENCNYAVELGKQSHFSLIGIGGQDILDGNHTLTMALIWQLMRAYTISILTQLAQTGHPVTDLEIISWANKKLKDGGKKGAFSGFQDPKLSDGKIVIDLIDCLRPGAIDYNQVTSGSPDANLRNAQYAISMARKIGARVYALPEDVVEMKPKMIMTIFACLMMIEFQARPKSMEQA